MAGFELRSGAKVTIFMKQPLYLCAISPHIFIVSLAWTIYSHCSDLIDNTIFFLVASSERGIEPGAADCQVGTKVRQ